MKERWIDCLQSISHAYQLNLRLMISVYRTFDNCYLYRVLISQTIHCSGNSCGIESGSKCHWEERALHINNIVTCWNRKISSIENVRWSETLKSIDEQREQKKGNNNHNKGNCCLFIKNVFSYSTKYTNTHTKHKQNIRLVGHQEWAKETKCMNRIICLCVCSYI